MAGEAAQLILSGDASGAIDAIARLQAGLTGLSQGAAQTARAMQQIDAASVTAFKNNMQVMVDAKQLSLQQALGFDIQYSAQLYTAERDRLQSIMQNDATTATDKQKLYEQLMGLDARYTAQVTENQKKMADEAKKAAGAWVAPFKEAFDQVGSAFESYVTGVIEHNESGAKLAKGLRNSLIRTGTNLVFASASKVGGALLAGGADKSQGKGIGDVIGDKLTNFVVNQLTQTGLLGTIAANTGISAATSATGAATSGISAAGAAGGILGGIKTIMGWLPGAQGGWDVPSYAGGGWSIPGGLAVLHPREMVLPAKLAQSVRDMVAGGGGHGGGDMHFHSYFGPFSDAAAVERGMRPMMARARREITAAIPT